MIMVDRFKYAFVWEIICIAYKGQVEADITLVRWESKQFWVVFGQQMPKNRPLSESEHYTQ